MIALEIAPAIFLVTSYGGLLAMMLAVWRPTAIAGVILNDIGPVIEPQGLLRIKSYVGKLPVPRSFEEGADILRWWFDAQFPKLAPQDWIALARRTWREHRGRLVPDYDPKVARTLQGADLQHLPTLWTHFDALARVPLMVIRGARSDMLASTTLDAMLSRRSALDIAVVADQGHAPLKLRSFPKRTAAGRVSVLGKGRIGRRPAAIEAKPRKTERRTQGVARRVRAGDLLAISCYLGPFFVNATADPIVMAYKLCKAGTRESLNQRTPFGDHCLKRSAAGGSQMHQGLQE